MSPVQNLLRYSEDLTKTIAWSISDCVVSSATMITDTNDGIAKYHFIYQSVINYGNAPITMSVSAKAGTKSWLCFDINGALIAYFDIGNGVLGTSQAGFKCSIAPDPDLGAGWYRCTMTYTPTRFLESFTYIMANGNSTASYQGNGTGTMYLTKFQVTNSNHAGPYVKTELGKIDTGNIRCLAQEPIDHQSQNYLFYSENFNDPVGKWTNTGLNPFTSGVADPFGGNSAMTINEDSSLATTHRFFQVESAELKNKLSTFSIFVKPRGANTVCIAGQAGGFASWFHLDAGTITTTSGINDSGMENYGNGWYRIWIRYIPNGNTVVLYGSTDADIVIFDGRGIATYDVFGAQLEIGNLSPYRRIDATPHELSARNRVANKRNVLKYSEQFDSTIWTKTNASITPNTIVAPDGTLTADRLNGDTTTGHHRVYSSGILPLNVPVTISVFAKAGTKNWLVIEVNDNFAFSGYFDLANGIVGTLGASVLSSKMEYLGDGWYRCSITFLNTPATTESFSIGIASANNIFSYAGTTEDNIYLWGAQMTSGNHPGGYAKTTNTIFDESDFRSVAQLKTPVSVLTDGDMEGTNPVVPLVDGDMEAAGVTAWSLSQATLSKQTTNPHSGTRLLRITSIAGAGTQYPQAFQTILTIGKTYRLTGYFRSDGTQGPIIAVGAQLIKTGTNSTSWQAVDETFVASATTIAWYFQLLNPAGTEYIEVDDITITDVTAGSYTSQAAILTKQTTSPHSGNQCLRVTADGSQSYAIANQAVTQGKRYRVIGWARSDGTRLPRVYLLNGALWVGTISTDWQRFDIAGVSNAAALVYFGHWSNTGYVDFDDLQVIDLSATPMRLPVQPYPPVSVLADGNQEATNPVVPLVDGNMEAAGIATWGAYNATLSKQAGVRTGGSGSQVLRVSYNSFAWGDGGQDILTTGHVYHVKAWARGDGTSRPGIILGGAGNLIEGTNSSAWQQLEFTGVCSGSGVFALYSPNLGAGNFVEFDEITITDVTAALDWLVYGNAIVSKETGTPHSGSQCLRFAYNGTPGWGGYKALTVGHRYLLKGWMRGDGVRAPVIYDFGTGAVLVTGTISTEWQYFEKAFCDVGALTIYLPSSAGYVEFDDLELIDLTLTPMRMTA